MLVDATILIQDVQLLCFTLVFGIVAFQRWSDKTRRWLWYTFLANGAGAVLDLLGSHLPNWISRGIDLEMIPLSYALLNVACVYFVGRGKRAIWGSVAILAATQPLFLAWCDQPNRVPSLAIQDLAIALECLMNAAILLPGEERSTRAPRWVLGGFLGLFAVPETARFVVAFAFHSNPDSYSHMLELISAVFYVVTTSVLPLAFVWMMNARLESNLVQQAVLDPLTDVLNRRGLEQALERELARYRRYGADVTIAILDLDHFKQLNDAHGHAAGDAVLTAVAKLAGNRLRQTDVFGRYGGEEFVLILPHTDTGQSRHVLEYLCAAIRENSFDFLNVTLRATASFGATTTRSRRPITSMELLIEADTALYRAKTNGRNCVCFFDEGDDGANHMAPPGSAHSTQ